MPKLSLTDNIGTITKRLFHFVPWSWSISLLCAVSVTTILSSPVSGESAQTAPRELKEVISEIEEAANRQNVAEVMRLYSPNFTNSDGLSHSSLSEALTQMWKKYPRLNYSTKLQSWEKQGDRFVAETITNIQGVRKSGDRSIELNSTIRSRQHFANQKVIKQEILTERTQITTGTNPPQITLNLPQTVSVGQKFGFDVIVNEPLGTQVLLGAAMEDKIDSNRYLNPGEFELQALPAGGIFKLVQAPKAPETLWYSAIVIREDGITAITQRVRVKQ